MRPIKFRAWDGGKMLYEDHIAFVPSIATNHPLRFGEALRLLQTKYLLEQFTGLLDKNGKEIWEGDIILDQWGVKTTVRIEEFYHADYEDSTYGYGFALSTHDPDEFKRNAEVIGNIHENADLLTNQEPDKT